MSFIRREGLSLYYEREGSGDPPIVFVHGWCCDHTAFQPQIEHFREKHTVVAMNLRGCGRSDRPDSGYDIPTLADDVAGLCLQLQLSKPVIVGHSLGGMIAVEVAARYPSLPHAIVAVDPGPLAPLPHVPQFFETFATNLEGPDGDSVRRLYIQALFHPSSPSEWRDTMVGTVCDVPAKIAAAMIRGVASWKGTGALLQCRTPLLVLLSKTGTSNDPSRLLPLKPDIHIGVTVGASHFMQFDVADQVNLMIEKFLRMAAK